MKQEGNIQLPSTYTIRKIKVKQKERMLLNLKYAMTNLKVKQTGN